MNLAEKERPFDVKLAAEPIGAELGAVEYVKPGVYVAMLGYGWPRTMLAYTGPSPTGPFTRSPKNVNFLNGSCCTYTGNPLRCS